MTDNNKYKSDLDTMFASIDEMLRQAHIVETLLDDPSISDEDKDIIVNKFENKSEELIEVMKRINNKNKT